jgi:molybdopterin synthase sulfur carrier subunit
MAIKVLYFASLRERMGRGEENVEAGDVSTVADVWMKVSGQDHAPANILSAVNMEYVDPSTPVKDGDEVAFFPPVTGG